VSIDKLPPLPPLEQRLRSAESPEDLFSIALEVAGQVGDLKAQVAELKSGRAITDMIGELSTARGELAMYKDRIREMDPYLVPEDEESEACCYFCGCDHLETHKPGCLWAAQQPKDEEP